VGCSHCARRATAMIYLTSWPAGIIYFIQLTVFILTARVLSIAIIRFRIVPRRRMWERPHSEAMHQFLEQGAQLGEQHTGLLIFASVAERYAEIIAGSGINTKLAPEAWADAISTMISAIKDGRSADGLLAAVNLCGEQLARGLPPGPRSSKKTTGRLVEI
jgi:putative membrane protein